MPTSTQLTNAINQSPNPAQAEQEIWEKTRYLVAQKPAAEGETITMPGYYNGKVVIPGPKADSSISEVLNDNDLNRLKAIHFIRFVDNNTTENASAEMRQALYTVMSKAEADDYEKQLRKYYAKQSKAVSSATA